MTDQYQPLRDADTPPAGERAKKPYRTPAVTCFGEIRDVTLGPTVDFGESGAGGINFRIQ